MPLQQQRKDHFKELLKDLGKPTQRGIKKCPKCATINGTRGSACKNKSCDVVFRGTGSRKKESTNACKITCNIPDVQVADTLKHIISHIFFEILHKLAPCTRQTSENLKKYI